MDYSLIVQAGRKYFLVIALGASLAVSFFLYGNTLAGGFVYDDLFFVRRPELREAQALIDVWRESYLPRNETAVAYRPFPMFTFSLNYVLFGESPMSFHAVNVVLHGLVVFFLFLAVWQLFGSRLIACFTALIYAFLPIHTEAVAFVKARDDVLATLFSLLAWYLFLRATRGGKVNAWQIFLASIVWMIAIMGKEIALFMPAAFTLIYWIREPVSFRQVAKVAALFLPATLSYFLTRFLILGEQFLTRDYVYFVFDPLRYADIFTRVWTSFKILFLYVGKTFVPVNLSATYTYDHLKLVTNPFFSFETIAGMLLLVGLGLLILDQSTRRTFGVATLLFLVPYAMISKFFFQLSEIASEKWMYLPSVGLSLLAGLALHALYQWNRTMGVTLLIGILALYAPVLIERNTVWASQETLYQSMVRDAPESAFAHYALAQLYYEQEKFDEAKTELFRALKIHQDYAPFMDLLGTLAAREGRGDIAGEAAKRSIELKPNELSVLLLAQQGKYRESLELIERLDPRIKKRSDVTFLLALNYYRLGMIEEAKKYFYWDPTLSEEEKIRALEEF